MSCSVRVHPLSWLNAARLGVQFMHWGLYAVPSYCPVTAAQKTCYAEHFWDTSINNSSGQHAYMQRVYGKDFQYQDFAPMFTCSDFDPQEWASLFKASGARGLTMTSKHHEGWTLWPNPRHANCAMSADAFFLPMRRQTIKLCH